MGREARGVSSKRLIISPAFWRCWAVKQRFSGKEAAHHNFSHRDGKIVVKRQILWQVADIDIFNGCSLVVEKLYCSGGWGEQPEQCLHKGCLATSVGTYHSEKIVVLYCEASIFQSRFAIIAHGEVCYFNYRFWLFHISMF